MTFPLCPLYPFQPTTDYMKVCGAACTHTTSTDCYGFKAPLSPLLTLT